MVTFLSKYRELILVMKSADINSPGKRICFHDGKYETKNTREINFIRKNQGYGVYISEAEDVSKEALLKEIEKESRAKKGD